MQGISRSPATLVNQNSTDNVGHNVVLSQKKSIASVAGKTHIAHLKSSNTSSEHSSSSKPIPKKNIFDRLIECLSKIFKFLTTYNTRPNELFITGKKFSELLKKKKIDNNKHYTITGDLELTGKKIKFLPPKMTVKGDLTLACRNLLSLPSHLTVKKTCTIKNTPFATLPSTFGGNNLIIENCNQLENIGNNLNLRGSLFIKGCPKLTSLPENLCLGDSLRIEKCMRMKSLPQKMSIGQSCIVNYCYNITSVPDSVINLGFTESGKTRCVDFKGTGLPENEINRLKRLKPEGIDLHLPDKDYKDYIFDLQETGENRNKKIPNYLRHAEQKKVISHLKNSVIEIGKSGPLKLTGRHFIFGDRPFVEVENDKCQTVLMCCIDDSFKVSKKSHWVPVAGILKTNKGSYELIITDWEKANAHAIHPFTQYGILAYQLLAEKNSQIENELFPQLQEQKYFATQDLKENRLDKINNKHPFTRVLMERNNGSQVWVELINSLPASALTEAGLSAGITSGLSVNDKKKPLSKEALEALHLDKNKDHDNEKAYFFGQGSYGKAKFARFTNPDTNKTTWCVAKKIKPISSKKTNRTTDISIKIQNEISKQKQAGDVAPTIYGFTKTKDKNGNIEFIIFMEIAEGTSGWNYLHDKKETLTLDEKKHIAKNLTASLEKMHNRSVFHNDLKWDNVYISSKTHGIKILDYGFAISEKMSSNYLRKSYRYLPPEVIKPGEKDHEKIDVYSTGIMLAKLFSDKNMSPLNVKRVWNDDGLINKSYIDTMLEGLNFPNEEIRALI
ncbi:MAG: protein kinase, partial [Endozoicomonas sp. (ex Botrylloides leachii)]|nr:protein kinase [Endozoicomonas sp. (ex Botrylloides leachii)]